MHNRSIMFFSRGRGGGHAMPDIAIIRQFRRLRPETDVRVVSYGSGAEAFRMLGEPVFDVGADDPSSPIDLIVPLGRALLAGDADLVISHEEPIILPLAHLTGRNTVFLTHWFTGPNDPFIDALGYADHVIFMEKEGIFPEPQKIRGKANNVALYFEIFKCLKTTARAFVQI